MTDDDSGLNVADTPGEDPRDCAGADDENPRCHFCGNHHPEGTTCDEAADVESDNRIKSQLSLRADLFERQARLCQADMQVIRMALNDNRPLEALYTVNEALDRLDEELETVEEVAPSGGGSQ